MQEQHTVEAPAKPDKVQNICLEKAFFEEGERNSIPCRT